MITTCHRVDVASTAVRRRGCDGVLVANTREAPMDGVDRLDREIAGYPAARGAQLVLETAARVVGGGADEVSDHRDPIASVRRRSAEAASTAGAR